MKNDNQIFGIRAIIEAIQSGTIIDKVFIQKETQGDLMRELLKSIKSKNINFSYVPVEKLNRLTPNPPRCRGNHCSYFFCCIRNYGGKCY